MAEKQPKRSTPEPFTKDDYEAIYWGLVDFLTMSSTMDEGRRARLNTLVSRLSEHVRHQELTGRTSSGLRRKVDIPERRDLLRQKLLARRHAEEHGNWAIYGEGLPEEGRLILLTIIEGTYAEAVERALTEPGFITEGMGGQIDPLGSVSKPP